jgi:WD40 repeat protein
MDTKLHPTVPLLLYGPPPSPLCFCAQDSVTSVACRGPDIVAASVDGTVRVFDVRMGRTYTDTLHHPVTSVVLSHDGQCMLAACLDSTLRWVCGSVGGLGVEVGACVRTRDASKHISD